MNNKFLQKAIDCLVIRDVYLRESSSFVQDGFEPKYLLPADDISVQFRHVVERADIVQVLNDAGETELLLRVFIEFGARWVTASQECDDLSSGLVEISARFIVEYLMLEQLEQESIDEFALKNASYHAWPYLREYLMNMCSRMNIPKIALPAKQLAHNRYSAQ